MKSGARNACLKILREFIEVPLKYICINDGRCKLHRKKISYSIFFVFSDLKKSYLYRKFFLL